MNPCLDSDTLGVYSDRPGCSSGKRDTFADIHLDTVLVGEWAHARGCGRFNMFVKHIWVYYFRDVRRIDVIVCLESTTNSCSSPTPLLDHVNISPRRFTGGTSHACSLLKSRLSPPVYSAHQVSRWPV